MLITICLKYQYYKFCCILQAFCSHLLDRSLVGKDLLTSLFGAVTVYFNYTGQAKCLDYTDAYTQALDDNTWEYQVIQILIDTLQSTFYKAVSLALVLQWDHSLGESIPNVTIVKQLSEAKILVQSTLFENFYKIMFIFVCF